MQWHNLPDCQIWTVGGDGKPTTLEPDELRELVANSAADDAAAAVLNGHSKPPPLAAFLGSQGDAP